MSFDDACEEWVNSVQLHCAPCKDDQGYWGVQPPNMTAMGSLPVLLSWWAKRPGLLKGV